MSYKEYFSPEITDETVYDYFERELPVKKSNYSYKEVIYYTEVLPLNKLSAILNLKK